MSLRTEFDTLIGAIHFFSRITVPGPFGHASVSLERAIRYYPAVGLLIGAIGAGVFALASLAWPKTLAVLAAVAIVIYLTGALHEDGWSDMVDGFGGGWTKEKILEIMRDSRVGSFGATALVMMLLVRVFSLIEIDARLIPLTLIAGHAYSRLCATFVLGALDYARTDGKAKPFAGHRLGLGERLFAAATAALPLALLPPLPALAGVVLGALASFWLARLYFRKIGGYTGDCIGAVQQLAEVAFYLGLLARFA